MIKKIALAAAIAASASFATWDYFPVLENHKGQVEIGEADDFQDKSTVGTFYAKARFTVIPNLELALNLPLVFYNTWDGKDTEQTGLDKIGLMVRYQFMPVMNAFLDVGLPFCSEDVCGEDDNINFHFGVQYSQTFGMVSFGSELGLALETKGENKSTPPWTMNLGLEADFAVSQMLTPYVGIDLYMLLGKYTNDGKNEGESYTGEMGIAPFAGLAIAFNQMFTLGFGGSVLFGSDDYMIIKTGHDDAAINITIKLDINF